MKDYEKMKRESRAEARWQRAQVRWDRMGFWTKVYALAEHLMVEKEKAGENLDADTACKLARAQVEAGPLFGGLNAAA